MYSSTSLSGARSLGGSSKTAVGRAKYERCVKTCSSVLEYLKGIKRGSPSITTDGGLDGDRPFRDRKTQIWDYGAHLRGVAELMTGWRAKKVVVVDQAQGSYERGRLRKGKRQAPRGFLQARLIDSRMEFQGCGWAASGPR